MDKKGLEKLLQLSTSLQNDTSSQPTEDVESKQNLDASMLDQIMGPDDATLMLQAMRVIENDVASRENHEIAFDNLEGLVEQLDNANNLQRLGLWQPILGQLGKSDAFYRRNGCAIIAAACQNNPPSQEAFVAANGLERVLDALSNDKDISVRRKALFALTSALRNNPAALQKFAQLGGWQVFRAHLESIQDLPMQKRLIFFLQSLYLPGESLGVETDVKQSFLPLFRNLVSSKEAAVDEDFGEKLHETIHAAQHWRAENS